MRKHKLIDNMCILIDFLIEYLNLKQKIIIFLSENVK